MPYELDDENKKDQQNPTSEAIVSGNSTGGNAGQGAGSGAQGVQGQQGFTNLNQYLNVNKTQGQDLQNKVVGGVEQQAQGAENTINQGEQNFQNQVNQASYKPDQTYEQNTVQNAQTIANTPDQLTDVQKRLSGVYGGPTQRDSSAETDATNTASQANNALQSFNGRYGLLQQQFNRPDYGQGQQTLDNLLLTGSQGFNTRAAADKAQYGGLNDLLNQSVARSSQAVDQAKTDTQSAADSLRNALNANQQEQLAGATARQQQAQANYDALVGGFTNNNLTPDQIQALGLTQGMTTYGVDPLQYLSQGDISQASAASPEERAQLQALATIQGLGAPALNTNATQLDINNPYSFDAQGFQNAIGSKQAGYNNAINTSYLRNGSAIDSILGGGGSAQDKWNALQPYLSQPSQTTGGVAGPAGSSLNDLLNPTGYVKDAINDPGMFNHNYYVHQQQNAQAVKSLLDELYGANKTLE